MSFTATDIFRKAMTLMDELEEQTGDFDTEDTEEYKNRTLDILNILLNRLYPFSQGITHTVGIRSIGTPILDFVTAIDLDDFLAGTVMPYGLAYHLLIEENPTVANTFLQTFQELIAQFAGYLNSETEDIEDLYGGITCTSAFN